MRRVLLVITGFGAGMLMLCLLLLNANATLELSAQRTETACKTTLLEDSSPFLSFPYSITGTNLIIERLAAYDGPFLEDGSNSEVVNVSAIVLRNGGIQGIEKASVVLTQGERKLYFDAQTIPPGQAVLVLERNRSEYIQKIYNACQGKEILAEREWCANKPPLIATVSNGTLAVTNNTEKTMKSIWIYYKNYLQDPGIYIGGITYKVGIRKLEPGQTLEINPPYYANGYSRIARVITE